MACLITQGELRCDIVTERHLASLYCSSGDGMRQYLDYKQIAVHGNGGEVRTHQSIRMVELAYGAERWHGTCKKCSGCELLQEFSGIGLLGDETYTK
jgi:hypothetical protein